MTSHRAGVDGKISTYRREIRLVMGEHSILAPLSLKLKASENDAMKMLL